MFYKSFEVYTELDQLPTMITQQDELYYATGRAASL